MTERKSVWFHELSGKEVVQYAKEVCDVAILPLGSIEQHGPHCPTASDTLNAMGMAEKIAEKSGAMVLPCPMYGSHPYHHWNMPGTIPLTFETHTALIMDIVRGAAIAGYNKFILLSAHGQVSSTIVAVHKLGLEGYFTLSMHWYDFLRDNQDVLEDNMWHADEAETSVALHLYPELIDMSKAEAGSCEGLIDPKWKIAPGAAAKPGQMYHFEGTFAEPEVLELGNGVVGDPTKATLEKGEKLVSRLTGHVSELVAEIRERYPVGVKPRVSVVPRA
ncbi:MAG: creatininase family protein [Deltaproteobacteria bacterium]|jgi:creatinine amidohydrolase/Fe(II)-dependent formamide hydrolase-like protein|nr:creatininase family protein [Deltaproteobacteria bacterium]